MLILKPSCPQESPVRLVNPERGFYAIFRAELTPHAQDMKKMAEDIFTPDGDDLLLCEVSLRSFANDAISAEGLLQLRELLSGLKARGGSLILRFLYDWDGHGLTAEPKNIEIILSHIRQLGPIVKDFSDAIFLHQGLFIGSWGEMHDTHYSSPDDMALLLRAQREAFGSEMLLCVRTLGQLRNLENLADADRNIGLYNDGIMGSSSDLGSYTEDRDEALSLQNHICLYAPNGGEAIYNPRYSNFPEAVKTLKKMRVSYLNRFHDSRALDLWSKTRISAPGIWHGIDGLSYIERHLGYRYVLRDVSMEKSLLRKVVRVRIALTNVGFAPVYHELRPKLTLCRKDAPSPTYTEVNCIAENKLTYDKTKKTYGKTRGLRKKTETDSIVFVSEINLSVLPLGSWHLYFRLWSEKYDREILLGNEEPEESGYPIGGFELT